MRAFIIAEIGINHNGDIDICKKLIDVAVVAGCNAVKLQKRQIDLVYTKEFLESARDSQWGSTQRDQKNGLEFSENEYVKIDKYCKEKNIEWFASAWDTESQKFLKKFNCNYNKVASPMIVYEKLLRLIAEEKKHTFISTGMSNIEDIEKAVKIFKDSECPFELMHCVSTYPMQTKHANLNLIRTLQNKFNCNVGYSGHESGLTVSYAAAALGISSLERHITLDRTMYGSDQSVSIEPHGLKKLIGKVREIESAMGDGVKVFLKEEVPIANKLREHIKE